MFSRLGFLAIVLGLALPAWSDGRKGTIAGFVRNGEGQPQMGAVVEILGVAPLQSVSAFTDEHGFFSANGLAAGMYDIRVSAASYLPSFLGGVGLRAGTKVTLNLTLNSLFDAIQAVPGHGAVEQEDWKWVLRSSSNRPILRALPDPAGQAPLSVEDSSKSHELKGTLSLVAGSASEGFGSTSDMNTGFSVERSVFASDRIGLWGNIGYSGTAGVAPASVVRASYVHKMDNGSAPEFALTARSLPATLPLPNSSFQSVAMSTSDSVTFGEGIEFRFGSDFETIQFLGHATAVRPFGSAEFHLSPNTVVEYHYVTSEPDGVMEKGFEASPPNLSESQPRVSMADYSPALEHAHHQELSLSRRLGRTNLQVAAFFDQVTNPALVGVGEASIDQGNILPDIYSGTFTYQGNNLKTEGLRVVMQQKLTGNITSTLDFAYGGVLDLENPNATLENVQQFMGTHNRHTAAAKVSGVMPKTKTHWAASYRWIDGQALTPVDMFNASAGQAAPYLNVYIRQPVPLVLPGHVEVLIDLRNLLAQGYVPVLDQDGRTVYLVQSARAVRGGLNFTF
jgi:Carboxypeptidase regulatory-like domain